MNYRMVFNTTGKVLCTCGALMLLPTAVSLIYGEWLTAISFSSTAIITFAVGIIITLLLKPKTTALFAKEGLVTVAIAWIMISLIGAIPFVICGDIPNYVDALFETISGFTTTGASIVNDVANLSKGCNFWRCFTNWIGGMGVLVFVMAITNKTTDRSMHILRAEMPGPIIDKFVPKARTTTIILYAIYAVLTVMLIIFLLCGGMPIFDSVCHAMATAGTGGFGIYSDSLVSASPYIQWVITIFMFLFGINFNLYFLIIIGKIGNFFKSRELWAYVGIAASATIIICIDVFAQYGNFADALRSSAFQVSSIITTTGFASADFAAWSALSKSILLFLMFTGACAGSTAGGFKISRFVILVKKVFNDLKRVVHPRTATIVKFEGKRLDDETLNGVSSYFSVYIICFIAILLILSIDTGIPTSTAFETNFASAMSCFNNIGPGLATTGPMSNYAAYSPLSKIVLSFAMLLGRLELYPVLLTFNVGTWIKQ